MKNRIDHRNVGYKNYRTELWQVGIVHAPISAFLEPKTVLQKPIQWLPLPRNFCFNADPFGVWHEGFFTVMVEALDYRVKRGELHYYRYDSEWRLHDHGIAMLQKFHLSYPFLIKHEGEIYLLPEAHESGKLTLYKATHFPRGWEPVATLLEQPIIDASVIEWQGRWWMFYALPGPDKRPLRELHVAYADSLFGPWLPHTGNPVREGFESSRPGGTPFVHEGQLYLPTQDCTLHYGDAVQLLRINRLTPDEFLAEKVERVDPHLFHTTYQDGLHTLSAAGDLTLIDVKYFDPSPKRRWINLERRFRWMLGI